MTAHHLTHLADDTHEPIRLLQLTDSHLLEDPQKTFAGINPYQALETVLNDVVAKHQFDLMINTGDIAQEDTQITYQQYLDLVARLNTPHFFIRGNHDESADFPIEDPNHRFQVIVVGKWCIILLNSQVDQHVNGYLDQDQLQQLSTTLQNYADHHMIIALHHHTFAVGCAWLDKHSLQNADEFLACITPYPNVKAVLCGHVHQEFSLKHQHIEFLSSPSTFLQFKPNSDDFSLDDRPSGYRMLELHPNGTLKSQVYYLDKAVGEVDHNLTKY